MREMTKLRREESAGKEPLISNLLFIVYLLFIVSAISTALSARRCDWGLISHVGIEKRLCTSPRKVTPSVVTDTLRETVRSIGPSLGFLPEDVSARSLRAAGANALLFAKVDTDVIRLIGRWRSDEMLRYLHVQAAPLMADYSRRMITAGQYHLIPNQMVPMN
ncbi:hypothetical protein THAOC_18563 [Thalassiosira oceanica]|uniref:Tyr recombinase domain-containing protein n=1 Tax=Thalassiosira oceanica TaxID=159749 RepID=K0S4E6_THAOC|nr:hypothetical protein THAOC_18563 [Thalassiosira oceanica]|eukprot:EJK61008.1 hypothetical protein THAOC_18563 [Thalassiosira oceanica]